MSFHDSELIEGYLRSEELVHAASRLAGGSSLGIGGVAGASLAFFLSAWTRVRESRHDGPVFVLAAHQDEADQLLEELETLSTSPVLPFPPWESLFLSDAEPEGDTYRQRLTVLDQLASRPTETCFVVAPVQAVLQPVPSPEALALSRFSLRRGADRDPLDLSETLIRCGLRRVSLVEKRGEFSSRGDIFDLFVYQGEHPLRLEFFGDTIDSMREFRAESQRSIANTETEELELLLVRKEEMFRPYAREEDTLITAYLGERGRFVVKDLQAVEERATRIFRNLLGGERSASEAGGDADGSDPGEESVLLGQFLERIERPGLIRAEGLSPATDEAGGDGQDRLEVLKLQFGSVERFHSADLGHVCATISGYASDGGRVEIFCDTEAEEKRLREILADHEVTVEPRVGIRIGGVRRGFEVGNLKTAVLTSRELFHRHLLRRIRRRTAPSRVINDFVELSKGDYIVHLVHGIGRFQGIERFEKDGVLQEFLALQYRGSVKIYVPVSKIDLVQKYIGSGDKTPILDKVGGTSWARKKDVVETALLDLASDLLRVQALREERRGIAYPEDSEWQREFEASFPFEETPDQLLASEAIRKDMQSERPMDRLICGDVGYGKTELAMRAAFKAVEGGRQVAMLVPTTVLAQQHFRTFSERMAEFPVTIEVLSRFRTTREQRAVLQRAAAGQVDILIGTHRILSDDVVFRNLGLVIIDEEQRFGVTHKEKLKRLRALVDVLTMTATPIPRTLHMSLLGLKEISSLSTAPQGRTAVETEVMHFERKKTREIIVRELNRDGQIFFVHNRIYDIDRVKFELERLAPEARVVTAHGRMKADQLEEVMVRFIEGEIDILISTTIIENGIDIQTANTIFINEADSYGLSELHQLRGRVGRYKHQAYCYLLLPEHRHVNPEAEKRLQALVEFSDLGAGFQIAMRDLEIRGAGNILGPEQSGHIAAVGYDMYCRLLERTVRQLRDEVEAEPVHVEVDLAVQAFVPEDFLNGEGPRLEVYRRVSQALTETAIDELGEELEDRFGTLPAQVRTLLDIQKLRVLCAANGIESVSHQDHNLILEGRESMRNLLETCPTRVTVLDARTVGVSLVDPRRRRAAATGRTMMGEETLEDADVFRVILEWLRTGTFPLERLRRAGRLRSTAS